MDTNVLNNLIGLDDNVNENDKTELSKAIYSTRGRPTLVTPFIIKDYDKLVLVGEDLYIYNGKFFEMPTPTEMNRMVYRFFIANDIVKFYNLSKEREIVRIISYHPDIKIVELDTQNFFLNLNNGVLNLKTMELTKHDPKYHFSYCLDVDYNTSDFECPVFTKFVQSCFATSGDWDTGFNYDQATVDALLQMLGYLIWPDIKIEGIFLLIGEGSNGKSVLMDVIKMFFPKKFITYMSLNTLSREEGFTRQNLLHSKINICSEQKGGSLDSEELKKVASGEGLSIQRKNSSAVDDELKVKVMVSANNMPYFNDTTYGILRRLYFFNFKNKYVSKSDYEKETDPLKYRIFKMVDKDWFREKMQGEKSAILNTLLMAVTSLRDNNWVIERTHDMKEIINDYKSNSDTIGTWLKDNYEIGNEFVDFVENQFLFNEFYNWYSDNFAKKCNYSVNSVSKRVKDLFRLDRIRKWDEYNRKNAYGFSLRRKEKSDTDLDVGDFTSSQNLTGEKNY